MKFLRCFLLIPFLLSMNSCSAEKVTYLGESKLVLAVEERDYNLDRVTEYKFFSNGLLAKTITHDTQKPENLFKSELKELNKKELEPALNFAAKLTKLDYENSFPWKEGLYQRGNVYKISFITNKKLEYINRSNPKDSSEISFEKILYYYQGHTESPIVFKELVSFLKTL